MKCGGDTRLVNHLYIKVYNDQAPQKLLTSLRIVRLLTIYLNYLSILIHSSLSKFITAVKRCELNLHYTVSLAIPSDASKNFHVHVKMKAYEPNFCIIEEAYPYNTSNVV